MLEWKNWRNIEFHKVGCVRSFPADFVEKTTVGQKSRLIFKCLPSTSHVALYHLPCVYTYTMKTLDRVKAKPTEVNEATGKDSWQSMVRLPGSGRPPSVAGCDQMTIASAAQFKRVAAISGEKHKALGQSTKSSNHWHCIHNSTKGRFVKLRCSEVFNRKNIRMMIILKWR